MHVVNATSTPVEYGIDSDSLYRNQVLYFRGRFMLVLFEGEFGARQTQRFIEEMLHVGHWSWDLNSGEMEWSRGLYDLLGVDSSSVSACSLEFDKIIHPDDRHSFADAEQ